MKILSKDQQEVQPAHRTMWWQTHRKMNFNTISWEFAQDPSLSFVLCPPCPFISLPLPSLLPYFLFLLLSPLSRLLQLWMKGAFTELTDNQSAMPCLWRLAVSVRHRGRGPRGAGDEGGSGGTRGHLSVYLSRTAKSESETMAWTPPGAGCYLPPWRYSTFLNFHPSPVVAPSDFFIYSFFFSTRNASLRDVSVYF